MFGSGLDRNGKTSDLVGKEDGMRTDLQLLLLLRHRLLSAIMPLDAKAIILPALYLVSARVDPSSSSEIREWEPRSNGGQ